MTNDAPIPNNPPLHAPSFAVRQTYWSEMEGLSVLLKVDEAEVRRVLEFTPYEYVGPYVWLEMYQFNRVHGMTYHPVVGDPYSSFGVVIPSRYGDQVGGYYAHSFKNKDFGTALGRETFGFPIKYATFTFGKVGRVAYVSMESETAAVEASVVIGAESEPLPSGTDRFPNLLVQSIPRVESPDGLLLQRLIVRENGPSTDIRDVPGEGAVKFGDAPSGVDDLAWIRNGLPVYGEYFEGRYEAGMGRVLKTLHIDEELRREV